MDDLEFAVEPEPAPEPGSSPEDVIDIEPRALPRWLAPVAAVGVLALLIATVIMRGSPEPVSSAGPEPIPQATVAPSGELAPLPLSPVGNQIRYPGSEIALDVALGGNLLYTLRYDVLTTTDAFRGTVLNQTQVSGLDYNYGGPPRHLFLDPPTATLWVLSAGVAPPRVLEFDSSSLRQRRAVRAPGSISGAAVLGGRLYLATTAGVAVLTPGKAAPTLVPGGPTMVETIAADPVRHRLLAVDSAAPGRRIWSIAPGGSAVVRGSTGLISPALAVVGANVWLGGYDAAGPVIRRLDPQTLAAVAASAVAPRAGAGAQLVAGESVLWVSAGHGQPQQLWCVDGQTGAIGGYWPGFSGAVSSRFGLMYAVRGADVVGLPINLGCMG